MERWTPVTDPQEIEALTNAGPDDLGTPYYKPSNGHLWVLTEELTTWRESRK